DYRMKVQEAGQKIGAVLARYGVVSRFAVDYLVHRDDSDAEWKVTALEINLRMGGTTHPFLALQFLTGGAIDADPRPFLAGGGPRQYYRATDNLNSESYRGLLPEDLVEILTVNKLHYSHGSESGVLFHLIGALSEFGKMGVTAMRKRREEVGDLH